MAELKKILAVDYGDVRTGLAVSDALGMMAGGIGTVKARGMHDLCNIVLEHAEKNKVGKIIIGDPVNMNGTRGPRSEKAHMFADLLRENTDIEVELYDERCSTMVAHTYLNATNTHGKKRKEVVDTLSAQIILQDYLDSRR
ncbi:MAG: Holliday junction resolvase RuvX [Ruminococcaceae bacterium]|nr:Holliday junction resolvase RuvX [Oscillospiraceae bacterium]